MFRHNFKHINYFDENKLIFFTNIIINNITLKSISTTIFNLERENLSNGYLFIFEKNSICFTKLHFIKRIIFYLHLRKKKICIVGLPFCVQQYLFGGVDFIRINNILVRLDKIFLTFNYFSTSNSTQLIKCRNCIEFNSCNGLGNKEENLYMWNFRLKSELRKHAQLKIKFKNSFFNNIYLDFVLHANNFQLNRTDRVLKYCDVYSHDNNLKYDIRFIYYCRYLDLTELNQEYLFLSKAVLNKDFLDFIFLEYYSRKKMVSFAYTFAIGDFYRETYYVYFYNKTLLDEFLYSVSKQISIQEKFERTYFLGFDFKNHKLAEFKTYSEIINLESFLIFLKKFNIELEKEIIDNSYNFLFVRRYDINGDLKSLKIEFTPKNSILVLENYFKKKFEFDVKCKNIYLKSEYYALDFSLHGGINKISAYRKNKFNL